MPRLSARDRAFLAEREARYLVDAARTVTQARWNLYHAFRFAFIDRPNARISVRGRSPGYFDGRGLVILRVSETFPSGETYVSEKVLRPDECGTAGDVTVDWHANDVHRKWLAAMKQDGLDAEG
jgi:hypothetical protein